MGIAICWPVRCSEVATCIRQPGLAVISSEAPVVAMLAALRSPSSRAGPGLRMFHTPALPQQISPSGISRTSRPGTARSSSRGWSRMPWAWARWQASWYAATAWTGWRGATGPSSAMISAKSRTLAEKALARWA